MSQVTELSRQVYPLLLFGRIRLEAETTVDGFSDRLNSRVTRGQPWPPPVFHNRGAGRVYDGRFHIPYGEWPRNRMSPGCAGEVRTEGNRILVTATIQATLLWLASIPLLVLCSLVVLAGPWFSSRGIQIELSLLMVIVALGLYRSITGFRGSFNAIVSGLIAACDPEDPIWQPDDNYDDEDADD